MYLSAVVRWRISVFIIIFSTRLHPFFMCQGCSYRSRHEDRKVAEFPFILLVGFVEGKKRGEVQEGEEVERIKGVGEGGDGDGDGEKRGD